MIVLESRVRVPEDAPTPEIAELMAAVRTAADVDPPDLTDIALRARRRDVALRGWIRFTPDPDRPWRALPDSGVRPAWAVRDLIEALGMIGDTDRAVKASEHGVRLLAAIRDDSSRLSRCCELGRVLARLVPPACLDPYIDLFTASTEIGDALHYRPQFIFALIDVGLLDAADRCMDAYARAGAGTWVRVYVEYLTYAGNFEAAERAAYERLGGMALMEAMAFLAHRLADAGDHRSALRIADTVAGRIADDPGDPAVFHSEAVNVPPVMLGVAINLTRTYIAAGALDRARLLLPDLERGLHRQTKEWAGHTTMEVLRLADEIGDRAAARRLHRKALRFRNLRILAELASRDIKTTDERGFTAVVEATAVLPAPTPLTTPPFIGRYVADQRAEDPARADRLAAIPTVRTALADEPATLRPDYRWVPPGSVSTSSALAKRLATTSWSDCLSDLARIDPDALRAVADAELAEG
jgi:hypothetical protein